MALTVAGCREETAPVLRMVQVSPDTLRIAIGASGGFDVLVTDEAGTPVDSAPVTWLSTDPTVADVDSAGVVTAAGLGRTTIVAVSDGFADSGTVETGLAFTALTAGDAHTCGLVPGGAIYCWGDGTHGQLGRGTTESGATPGRVQAAVAFTSVTAGGGHTCAIAEDGAAYCWGRGDRGQRGDGGSANALQPVPVSTSAAFGALSAGRDHTCGITTVKVLFCWGSNLSGQLGNGGFLNQLVPDSAAIDLGFLDVRSGSSHTCGVGVDGRGYCWGANGDGQLGLEYVSSPVPVPTLLPAVLTFHTVQAGLGPYSCGIWLPRPVFCWGRGDDGQLGTGTVVEQDSLALVDAMLPFQTIDPGAFHTCGTTVALETYCWGTSRLGLPQVTHSDVPVQVPIPLAQIVTGVFHTCGITADGVAYCWGGNDRGQLGTGGTAPSNTPALVALQLAGP